MLHVEHFRLRGLVVSRETFADICLPLRSVASDGIFPANVITPVI